MTASPSLSPPNLEPLGRANPSFRKAAPTRLVDVRGTDESHCAYQTAVRTFCGRPVLRVRRGRFGQVGGPACLACRRTLGRLGLLGLVGEPSEDSVPPAECQAFTKRGTPCERAPVLAGYCPSHKHLAADA